MYGQSRNTIPAWLDGLDIRIAKVLVWQGFKNRDEVIYALERGDYIPRIREYSVTRISAWLTSSGIRHDFRKNAPGIMAMGRRGLNRAPKSAEEHERSRSTSRLLDFLIEHLRLKSDAALARAIGVTPQCMSRLRNGRAPIGPTLWIRMEGAAGISVAELKRHLAEQMEQ